MSWKELCRVSDIPADDVLPRAVDGIPIAVCRVGGDYFAFADRCSHENVALSDGFLEGTEIECPLHGSRFDVRNGRCLTPPATGDLSTYPTKVQDGTLYVLLATASTICE